MKVKIKNGSGEELEAELTYGRLTDTVAIDAPPVGIFTITGESARALRDVLIELIPNRRNDILTDRRKDEASS